MTDETITPRLKLIAKRDFDLVRGKYKIMNEGVDSVIGGASAWDVLALTIVPGSGLKILDVKVLNEKNEAVFLKLLREGFTY